MNQDEDPFDCFGDGDSDHDNEDDRRAGQSRNSASLSLQHRDPSNGILAFHAGTEQALINYVQKQLLASDNNVLKTPASKVLGHIDDFCLKRHWMMHVGYEKSPILEKFLKECKETTAPDAEKTLALVELGTYCGYSSILMANALQAKLSCDHFEIYTVEVAEQNAKIAREMIKLSGLQDHIHVLLFDPNRESLTDLLRREMPPASTIDFLFLDHSKSMYLRDLQQLENSRFVQKGCFVAADNVIFAQIDDYREYIAELAHRGIVRTQLKLSWLEYCEPDHNGDETKKNMMKDGIGK